MVPPQGLVDTFKIQIKHSIQQLKHLETEKTNLLTSVSTANVEDWKLKISSLKDDILKLNDNIKRLQNASLVKARLKKIKKRRERMKQRKEEQKRKRPVLLPTNPTSTPRVSKKEAIASDIINQKEQDAIRILKKLQLLKQLRSLRMNLHPESSASSARELLFNQRTHKLIQFWDKALIEIRSKKSVTNSEPSLEDQWSNVLFGEPSEYQQTSTMTKLIETRNIWDSYLVPSNEPFGSSIPIGWVLPNEEVLSSWNQYRLDVPK